MNITNVFSEQLKKLRTDKKLTQEQLGEKSGIAVTTIRLYEQGRGNPTLTTIADLAAALGVTVSQLCGEESPAQRVEIATYADLFCALSQMNDAALTLDCGTFCNGKPQSDYGEISIQCHSTDDSFAVPDDMPVNVLQEYTTTIRFKDKTLYTFFSTYKKMLEMIESETDELGKETLNSMKDAWLETQFQKNKDNRIAVPL